MAKHFANTKYTERFYDRLIRKFKPVLKAISRLNLRYRQFDQIRSNLCCLSLSLSTIYESTPNQPTCCIKLTSPFAIRQPCHFILLRANVNKSATHLCIYSLRKYSQLSPNIKILQEFSLVV